MIVEIVTNVVVIGVAGATAAMGIHSRLRKPAIRLADAVAWRHCAACPHVGHCAEADACMKPSPSIREMLWSKEQQRQAALSFKANPTAFWLDPNLWGDDPDWEARLFPAPKTPGKIDEHKLVTAQMQQAAAALYNPTATVRIVQDSNRKMEPVPEPLPCGCPGDTPIGGGRQPYLGWPFSVCYRCMAEWEPPSNDPTGRRLGQGEQVIFADFKHGVCPAEDCRAPCKLEDRYETPFYHCTSPICDRSYQGWGTNGQQWVRSKNEGASGWRHKRTPAEIKARNRKLKKKRVATHEEYDSDLPLPPRMR